MVSLLERGIPQAELAPQLPAEQQYFLPRRSYRDALLNTYEEVGASMLDARTSKFFLDQEYYVAKRVPRKFLHRLGFNWPEIDGLFNGKYPDGNPPKKMLQKDLIIASARYGVKVGNVDTNFSISLNMNTQGRLWTTEIRPLDSRLPISGRGDLVQGAMYSLGHDEKYVQSFNFNDSEEITKDYKAAIRVLDIIRYANEDSRLVPLRTDSPNHSLLQSR